MNAKASCFAYYYILRQCIIFGRLKVRRSISCIRNNKETKDEGIRAGVLQRCRIIRGSQQKQQCRNTWKITNVPCGMYIV